MTLLPFLSITPYSAFCSLLAFVPTLLTVKLRSNLSLVFVREALQLSGVRSLSNFVLTDFLSTSLPSLSVRVRLISALSSSLSVVSLR